ncbi:hypothetical protein CKA32_007127 [Geitlerinema sp. FC II]|nr:hypothetical protein CKA32_007127 [Geitlerinema sp. FC II]
MLTYFCAIRTRQNTDEINFNIVIFSCAFYTVYHGLNHTLSW